MAASSSSSTGLISIQVEVSSSGGNSMIDLNDIPASITIGELKTKLKVQPNSRFGRLNEYENWDNRRSLSDYLVKNGEQLMCVIQCIRTEGQPDFDDYDQWLSTYKSQ